MGKNAKTALIDSNNGRNIIPPPNAALKVVKRHLEAVKNSRNGNQSVHALYGIDETDLSIIENTLAGYSYSDISRKIGRPLSTIQRRGRKLVENGIFIPRSHINFRKFGLRRGILQFKCKSANLEEAVKKIATITGVESAAAYLGSLDVIANVVYADSKEVLGIISEVQKFDLVNDVTWSEEIHSVPF
jgi:DNA-binding Lrp family transcriptional regulator